MTMGLFVIVRAILVRLIFACHGMISIWRLYAVTGDPRSWYICLALVGLTAEMVFTIWKKKGQEWKWFCPSVLFFLMCSVPAVWFLELHELDNRIQLRANFNATGAFVETGNHTAEDLSAKIAGLGLEIRIPLKLSSDQWVRTLEQALLLFLIIGRWILPKGKLTHDQLSQLLLVYIGTAADIVEFFEAFKEDEVRYNVVLCQVILSIWSWSLLQFTMVLTATKARKDQSGLIPAQPGGGDGQDSCCTPDVYGIIISIFMQDAPFLILRLLLIFKYGVLSYTNMFFTCKNTLVIALLLYRLVVVQMERRETRKKQTRYIGLTRSSSSLGVKNWVNTNGGHMYTPVDTRSTTPGQNYTPSLPYTPLTLRHNNKHDDFIVSNGGPDVADLDEIIKNNISMDEIQTYLHPIPNVDDEIFLDDDLLQSESCPEDEDDTRSMYDNITSFV